MNDSQYQLEALSTARLAAVRSRIAAAERAYGRPAGTVELLAVSKTQPVEAIAAALKAGQRDFGESYLQEAQLKLTALAAENLTWHFTGALQSNKTLWIAQHFSWVHGVDRLKIAERLSAQRPAELPALNVCLQVKLGDEPRKAGIEPALVADLAHAVAALPRLCLRGLMTLPPESDDVATQRAYFRALREALQSLREQGLALDTLSMGMSRDLEAAIAEGATLVRVGTALFGARPRKT
ncbi:MAG: YggS family pyridoxal phosphate-dependent enzyme [Pseudomonadota bacterium]